MAPLSAKPIFEGSRTLWTLSDRFSNQLPADPELKNFRRQVRGAAFSYVEPTPTSAPSTVAISRSFAKELGLSEEDLSRQEFAEIFGGSRLLPESKPFAMCYGGHQFGHWAGQLGDGRAINLGEVKTSENDFWTIQLKGSGPTPYSRTADGLAVLRSSVREFLCSEAMFHLGIPTTRALSLVLTGDSVTRDMFYDGRPEEEPGAVVCRVAPSFLRFGNFQILTANQDFDLLKQLADFCIDNEFEGISSEDPSCYDQWFREICRRTAEMVVGWMGVGFVHGVMNTDNMSILGLTIDYGPYGWLEPFDPMWTPNTTDASGKRYRFGAQMDVAHWNLYQLANAIAPLFDDIEPLKESLEFFQSETRSLWLQNSKNKIGLIAKKDGDEDLVDDLWNQMPDWNVDMTRFYRKLASGLQTAFGNEDSTESRLDAISDNLSGCFYGKESDTKAKMSPWLSKYLNRMESEVTKENVELMNRTNPKYVLRNFLAQQAIEKATGGDFSMIHRLQKVLEKPFDEQPENDDLDQNRPEWAANRPGCSMLSCSS